MQVSTPSGSSLGILALGLLLLSSCAPALPLLAGGSTTPARRNDLALGAASRVPVGSLRRRQDETPEAFAREAQGQGTVPAAFYRRGLPKHYDLGLLVAGSTARLDLRKEWVLKEDVQRPALIGGISPYGGWFQGEGAGKGGRVGVEVPMLFALEIGGLYELWTGLRLGGERAQGELSTGGSTSDFGAWGLRAGFVLGAGFGFRWLHVLLELSSAYEHWWLSEGQEERSLGGVVLTPAFALRFRL